MPVNNSSLFKKYREMFELNWFVETGTFQGDGIKYALEAGFDRIKSVELNKENYENCFEKYKHISDIVDLHYGSSENLFSEMIKFINEPILFFLDSHYSGCGDTYVTSKGRTYSSIVSELFSISKHPIKNHVILIDDRRDFGTINMDYVQESKIKELLLKINPNYHILYDTGDYSNKIFKDDIIIALPPIE